MAKYTAAFKKLWKESGVGKALQDAKISNQDIGKIKQNISSFDMEEMPNYLSDIKSIITGSTQSDLKLFHTADKLGVFNGANNAYRRLDNSINSRIAEAESKQQSQLLYGRTDDGVTARAQENAIRDDPKFQEAVRRNIETEEYINRYNDLKYRHSKEFQNKQHADNIMAAYNRGVNERAQRSVTEKNAATATGKKQKAMLDNAHNNVNILQDPLAMRVARENNLDLSDPQQVEKLKSIISTANKQGAARAAEIGSGKPLQEGTVSQPWTSDEKKAGIRNLREQPGGVKVEDSPLYDEETLLAKMGGNKNNFGYSDASKYRLKQVKQKLDDDYETIIKNGGTFNEQQAAWKKTQDEATKMLEKGPDLADYAFGNNLHYKGLGFAAMVGLTGVAFGGAKSNAQLYSSPF